MTPPVYTPVLRWKRAEQKALRAIKSPERSMITPLAELVPRDYSATKGKAAPTNGQAAEMHAETIRLAWGDSPIYVDSSLLSVSVCQSPIGHPLQLLGTLAPVQGLALVPVVHLGMAPEEVAKLAWAAKAAGAGAAVRVKRAHFGDVNLTDSVQRLVSGLEAGADAVDLLLDYEITDASAPSVSELLSRIGFNSWRTVVAISGSFPKDLTGFAPGEHLHSRADYLWWRSQITGGRPTCAFGDYVTQHPIYSEPPGRANFSASIRYVTETAWVIMRGEGVFNDDGPGFAQWPANAQLLCDRPEFCGADFSDGDRYISDMGQQSAKTGNAETWLSAGLNHHMVYTARQVSNLLEK